MKKNSKKKRRNQPNNSTDIKRLAAPVAAGHTRRRVDPLRLWFEHSRVT